jgi:RND family efflux transporter MFP subunit
MGLSSSSPPPAQHRSRARVIIITVGFAALLLLGTGGAVYRAEGQAQAPRAAPPPVPVVTRLAETRDVPHVVEVVGTLQPLQAVTLRAQVDGILTEVLFKEGDFVRRGQVLARIDDRALRAALAAAQAQLARDQAQLRAAELDLSRARTLLQKNAGSQQVVDQQTAAVDQLKAAVALDEANVEAAQVNVSYTEIVSPIDGRIGMRQVDPGNLVRQADASGIVSIAQVDPLSVVFAVPQQVFAAMRDHADEPGGKAVEVIDRASAATLAEGEITSFDNQIDTTTGTARIRAVFANGAEKLTPGAFVSVRIATGVSSGAVVVPKLAVRPGVEGDFVYRVTNGQAERVSVTLGYSNDDLAVIATGVASGDAIVIDGYSRLRPGAAVAATEAPNRDQPARTAQQTVISRQ